jgi:hypothetical protein
VRYSIREGLKIWIRAGILAMNLKTTAKRAQGDRINDIKKEVQKRIIQGFKRKIIFKYRLTHFSADFNKLPYLN